MARGPNFPLLIVILVLAFYIWNGNSLSLAQGSTAVDDSSNTPEPVPVQNQEFADTPDNHEPKLATIQEKKSVSELPPVQESNSYNYIVIFGTILSVLILMVLIIYLVLRKKYDVKVKFTSSKKIINFPTEEKRKLVRRRKIKNDYY